MATDTRLEGSLLGKETSYNNDYDSSLLFPISRKEKRDEIGVSEPLPFHGVDIWNAYEASWLNPKGKPEVAIVEFYIPCESPDILESKSLKLYFNSFNQTKFSSAEEVRQTIIRDLSKEAKTPVKVRVHSPQVFEGDQLQEFNGLCLDHLDIEANEYQVNPKLLECTEDVIEEGLYSNLLKSNCLITDQPDWGSVYIHYKGPKINHRSLLKYIISFRQHNEFHEQCIERIFMDLMRECKPEKLTVYGKYTRRGGLDINPFRSNFETAPARFVRSARQ